MEAVCCRLFMYLFLSFVFYVVLEINPLVPGGNQAELSGNP